jgi:hypothetical protein
MRHCNTKQTINVQRSIPSSINQRRESTTYPIDAHWRDAPGLLVLGEHALMYHLKARIINILLGRRLRLGLPKELCQLLERVEWVRSGHELVSRRIISWKGARI